MSHFLRCALVCIAVFTTLCMQGCVSSSEFRDRSQGRSLTSDKLRTFRDIAEFETYRERVRALAKKNGAWWAAKDRRDIDGLLASNDLTLCDPSNEECGVLSEEVVVTGVRASLSSSMSVARSITNNQVSGVDEGDIVKLYDRFLIVLQHGRLFSIDIGTDPGAVLRLIDRIDVYEPGGSDYDWYDELLISGNSLIVTGYSSQQQASIVSLFQIDDRGVMELQSKFFIESDDYYSFGNYATRLRDDKLILYTPMDLSEIPSDEPVHIPRVRRWTPATGLSPWTPLFDITDVYRPIQETLTPSVHVVSTCSIRSASEAICSSRGVVGPSYREMYVSADFVYLWLSSDDDYWRESDTKKPACPNQQDLTAFGAQPAAVYRMTIDGGALQAVRAYGNPDDQFAFNEADGYLYALLGYSPEQCEPPDNIPHAFVRIPLTMFGSLPQSVGLSRYTSVPTPEGYALQTRYSVDDVIYGASRGWWNAYYGRARDERSEFIVVPLRRPARYTVLSAPHSAERIELLGENAVAFGYGDLRALSVSTIDLRDEPRIADTEHLWGALQSEGRSHAFNARIEADGSSLFGLPTYDRELMRVDWREGYKSFISFLIATSSLDLEYVDALSPTRAPPDDEYKCEVSCFDWYGNARPIFIDQRIFALTGVELIEGALVSGRLAEIGRMRTTGTPTHTRAREGFSEARN